ncbi:hypothetical protein [Adlercreutzia muris]|uniref:hypothetical protein n=1 Tax=Adlercreutzia muris TaxID=1796610 RepID=UPI0013665887|nr:hypothetical protein [Adlercreutzia muris]NCA32119.1 hypothetical protein [Adlercreutzia muris]
MASSLYVGETVSSLKEVPVQPDGLEWGVNDISDPDAGRVQDANCTMMKRRIARKRTLSLSWANPTLAQASAILRMFAPEYLWVRFIDPEEGGFITRNFYTGDKKAPFRCIDLRGPGGETAVLSTLSFNIVER